jgi:Ca2+-binding EF-hand superfamily protein
MQKINSCKHDKCWQGTQGNSNFCALHSKMHQDQSISLFSKFFKTIGKKWRKFIAQLK